MIASVHAPGAFTDAKATQDLTGLIVTPGFIDGHVHVESSHMLPHHYASVVVPQGTTTIFWDPHELANVLGLDGIRYAVEATRNLPLRFIVQASSCVPAAPGLEISGADFKADEIRDLMSWPDVAGLAEVMDMRAVLETQPRMMGILEAANASGKIIEGHARGLSGPGLMAYLSAGISGDHEITSGADALEKLRAGFTVEIRGSHDYLLPDVVAAINTLPVDPDEPHRLHRRCVPGLSGRTWRHQRRAAAADPLRPRPAAGDPLRHHQQRDPSATRRSRPRGGGPAGRPGRAVRSEGSEGRSGLFRRPACGAGRKADRAAGRRCPAAREHHEGRAAHCRRFPHSGAGRGPMAGHSSRPSRARASIPGARPRSRCATASQSCRTISA